MAKGKGSGKMRRMGDLPSKTCLTCGFPFTWRKKWARDWDGVKYCSDKCRRNKPAAGSEAADQK